MLKRVWLAGVVAAAVVVLSTAGEAGAVSTWYLSTVSLESGIVPTPVNPQVTLGIGESVTLYLWAQFGTGTSTVFGLDFDETNNPIVAGSNVQLWNGVINSLQDGYDPADEQTWIWRYEGWNLRQGMDGDSVGFGRAGGWGGEPGSVWGAGLTNTYRLQGDPTWRGTSSPYQYYVGSVTFTGATEGQTNIFLTINECLMLGNTGMIGTPASPGMYMGAGEGSAVPVSADGATYYIAAGVTGSLADATIVVVPEPGVGAVVVMVAVGVMRRGGSGEFRITRDECRVEGDLRAVSPQLLIASRRGVGVIGAMGVMRRGRGAIGE